MPAWCKNYQAMSDHKECKVGIPYESVKSDETIAYGYPCWAKHGRPACAQAVYPTKEELQAEDAKFAEFMKKFQADLDNDICPHCGQAIARYEQVGRCVYGRPCGCRLYQGKLKQPSK